MKQETFDRIACLAESRNRGWIHAGDVPRCRAYLDGERVNSVRSINRAKGRLVVVIQPLRLDKHKKRALTRTIHGHRIRLEPF